MSDTDTSRRIPEAPDRDHLAHALIVDQAELTVTPGDTLGWKPGKRLVIARPVDYRAYIAGLGSGAVEGEFTFTFTVSWRGLVERSRPILLIHPYTELNLPRTIVPVMDLTEQIAEKTVAWCAHGLMKHYVDVAWAFYRLHDQIDCAKLERLVDAKLDVGRRLFPSEYTEFTDRASIRAALEHPDQHVPPQGDAADDKASQLGFAGAGLNKTRAIHLVRTRLLPALLA